ncbi:MBL fold metallo-hydrolase [Ornithinimicrobium sp. INDO-MA30-4]|uniref:MBL fold metallo-hydrolase n=1 Tax=Ornithinimicrobium sp. INDO-MA30-4 TaxID=2908651 RepID=UPI0037C9676A
MTFIEGHSGIIVIDPLISTETAAAALALYRQHRGDREVRALIYTHSHIDHLGASSVSLLKMTSTRGAFRLLLPRASLKKPWPRTCSLAPPWADVLAICMGPRLSGARREQSGQAWGKPPPLGRPA